MHRPSQDSSPSHGSEQVLQSAPVNGIEEPSKMANRLSGLIESPFIIALSFLTLLSMFNELMRKEKDLNCRYMPGGQLYRFGYLIRSLRLCHYAEFQSQNNLRL
jgi:hypothetical protein